MELASRGSNCSNFWGLVCWHEQFNMTSRDQHGRPMASHLPWSRMNGTAKWKTYELDIREQHHWPWLELMWHSLMTEWGISLHLNFTFQPTIDIDVAFKHLGRSRWKYYALQSRDFLCGRWGLVRERWCVLKGRKKILLIRRMCSRSGMEMSQSGGLF